MKITPKAIALALLASLLFSAMLLMGAVPPMPALPGPDVRLAWDASPTPGITNYVLYAVRHETPEVEPIRVSVGTNTTVTLESVQPGVWTLWATAMKDGLESLPSESLVVEVPEPPTSMRTVTVQYGGTITNFYDVGFFRLRIGE